MTGRGVATAGIGDGAVVAVGGLRLGPPTPNPARGRLTTEIVGPPTGAATLDIYDIAGRRIRTFAIRLGTSGHGRVDWDGRGTGGGAVPAGVYLMRLTSGAEVRVRTAVLLR